MRQNRSLSQKSIDKESSDSSKDSILEELERNKTRRKPNISFLEKQIKKLTIDDQKDRLKYKEEEMKAKLKVNASKGSKHKSPGLIRKASTVLEKRDEEILKMV